MKKYLVKSATVPILLLLLTSLFFASFTTLAKGDSRSSCIYCSQYAPPELDDDIGESEAVCDSIEYYFSQLSNYDWVANYAGISEAPLVDNIIYCDNNYDLTTVFYKGHTLFDNQIGYYAFCIYDDDYNKFLATNWQVYGCYPQKHNFVFFWTCTCAAEYSGFPQAWLQGDEPWDVNDKCYIGFAGVSKPFTEETGYGSYTYADFCDRFYDYATQGYTVMTAIYQAATETLSNGMNNELFTGYQVYAKEMWITSYMTWWGEDVYIV
jgi:hypothetical protein